MKKLLPAVLAVVGLLVGMAAADTYTPRLNLIEPTIGSLTWGGKTNYNFAIMDSSAAAQFQPNTFTASNTATGPWLWSGSSIALTGSNGYIVSQSSITANEFFGIFNGAVVGVSSSASNLSGGTGGGLPYQSGPGATTFLAPGTTGYVLSMVSGGVPGWTAAASSATNIAGGAANSIPYQSGPNATTFLPQGTGVLQESAGPPSFTTSPTITGANLTGVNAGALVNGPVASSILPSTVAYTSVDNSWSHAQTSGSSWTINADLQAQNVNATTNFKANGTPGVGITCGAGTALQPTVTEGIITAASCIAAGAGSGSVTWTKYTKSYTDFSTAGTSNSITIFSAGAGMVIQGVAIHHTTAFSGGAISAYTVSVGTTGANSLYSPPFDTFQTVSNRAFQTSMNFSSENVGATWNVTATATSTGANLNAATQGSVDIWVESSTLP